MGRGLFGFLILVSFKPASQTATTEDIVKEAVCALGIVFVALGCSEPPTTPKPRWGKRR